MVSPSPSLDPDPEPERSLAKLSLMLPLRPMRAEPDRRLVVGVEGTGVGEVVGGRDEEVGF